MANVELTTIAEFIAKVGSTDATYQALTRVKYLSGYANWAALKAAHTAAGFPVWEVRITQPFAPSATETTHANLVLSVEADGAINPAAATTFTITSWKNPGTRKVFGGSGVVAFGLAATPQINLGWYAGNTSTTVTALMWTGIVASLTNNFGGNVVIPGCTYQTAGDVTLPPGTRFYGVSNHTGLLGGAVLELTSNSKSIFIIPSLSRANHFADITFNCAATIGSYGVRMTGTVATGNIHGTTFDRCTFNAGTVGADVYDSASNALEVIQISFRDCYFVGQSVAGFRSNTINGAYTFDTCTFAPAWNGVADGSLYTAGGGQGNFKNCLWIGNNIAPNAYHTNVASYDPVTGIWTTTGAHNLPALGTPHPILLQVAGGSLPTVYAGLTLYYTRTLSANTFTLHNSSEESVANTGIITGGGAGSGTMQVRTRIPITANRPRAAISVEGTNNGVNVLGGQMEGLCYFLRNIATVDTSIAIVLEKVNTQGLIYIEGSCKIISIACTHYALCFTDNMTGFANVYSYGDSIHYHGGGFYYDNGSTNAPLRLDSFVGGSFMRCEDDYYRGKRIELQMTSYLSSLFGSLPNLTLLRGANDLPLLVLGTGNSRKEPADYYTFSRATGGTTPGFLKVLGNYYGGGFSWTVGLHVPGGLRHSGRYINDSFQTIGNTTSPIAISVEQNANSMFVMTPDKNYTFDFSAFSANGELIEMWFIATGSNNFTMTFGTGTDAPPLVLGTTAGRWCVQLKSLSGVLYQIGTPILST